MPATMISSSFIVFLAIILCVSFTEVRSFNPVPLSQTRDYSPGRVKHLSVAMEETITETEDVLDSRRSPSLECEDTGTNVVKKDPIESVNKRREYQMNLGRALDVIRKDYPDLLLKAPDYSIYHDDIEVVDPSGMTLHGLSNYKMSFQFVHSIVKFFYCTEHSGLTFRLFYDFARDTIRVSWHATLAPKQLYGGIDNKLHVDGASVYKLDVQSGLVKSHHIENLLINNSPLEAPQGLFHALRYEVVNPLGVPVGSTLGLAGDINPQPSAKRDDSIATTMAMTSDLSSSSSEEASDAAFELKNAARVKFGLKPISREEFDQIEEQVRAQSEVVNSNYRNAGQLRAEKKKKDYGFLSKLFGDALPDTCESNDDCDRPALCCDLIVKKVCCRSGAMIPATRYPPRVQPMMQPISGKPGDDELPPKIPQRY